MRKHPIFTYWGSWLADAFGGSWSVYERISGITAPLLFVTARAGWLPGQIRGRDVNDLATWVAIVLFGGTLLLRLAFAPYRLQQRALGASAGALQVPQRVTVSISPTSLMEMLRGHTDVQQKRLIADYLGKWMQLTARVRNVVDHRSNSDRWLVMVQLEGKSYSSSILIFGANWSERVAVLRIGDQITVLGKIDDADDHSINLKECELLSVTTPTPESEKDK